MVKRIQRDENGNRVRFNADGSPRVPYWSQPQNAKKVKRVHNPTVVPFPRIEFDRYQDGNVALPIFKTTNARSIKRALVRLGLKGHTRKERDAAYKKAKVA